MPDAHATFFSVDALSFRFPAGSGSSALVLDGVRMQAARGETAVVLGRADAGKTTLARIVSGLVPRFTGGAIQGSVYAGGQALRGVPPYDLVQTVGLVSQDSDEQLLSTRCDTEVAFALESLGVARQEMRRRVAESLERVGLPGFEARNPSTMSGGEKKRLLLACLDAVRPRLWILDEALGELDFEWKLRALDLIRDRDGTVVLMESRWTPLVERRGTSFFLLDGGRMQARAAAAVDAIDAGFSAALLSAGIRPRPASRSPAANRDEHLRIDGLDFRFQDNSGFHLAIERLDLRLGEICALVGKNGSGKSTLGRILCGLLPAQRGEIRIGPPGSMRPAPPSELNARVGYLFQNPDHQIFLPTVREELGLGLRGRGADPRRIDALIREAAERFNLPDLEAPPALLSYGARRRLQAACYFLLHRDLLVLDEIDSGLSYGEIQSLVGALSSRTPGLLLITHDLLLARTAAHRVLVMEDGRITEDRGAEAWAAIVEREGREAP